MRKGTDKRIFQNKESESLFCNSISHHLIIVWGIYGNKAKGTETTESSAVIKRGEQEQKVLARTGGGGFHADTSPPP